MLYSFVQFIPEYGGFPKLGGIILGVPIIRIIVFGVYIGVPLFWETTTYSPLRCMLEDQLACCRHPNVCVRIAAKEQCMDSMGLHGSCRGTSRVCG